MVPKEAYQMLLTTLETEDPGLTRCGLVRLTASDGTIAWVCMYMYTCIYRCMTGGTIAYGLEC